jgi:hypothetical protein
MRKILHLENKTTNSHKYYGSLVALCNDNEALPYHTLKRLKFEIPWENETFKIRVGSLLTPSDVKAGRNNEYGFAFVVEFVNLLPVTAEQ